MGSPTVGQLSSGDAVEILGNKGSWTEIVLSDEIVGSCVRTRAAVKPVYVSPGSGISISSARRLVLKGAGKYRLPEPTRLAHNAVTRYKRELAESL